MKKSILFLAAGFLLIACSSSSGDSAVRMTASVERTEIKTGIELGDRAPDLVFEAPNGQRIALSSLRGKMVLIDFWASWCSPCRVENPNLVRLYEKYKEREFKDGSGFTIYGVSLDKSKESWEAAIQKDGLVWENHVSDLKGWDSEPAARYGIMAIPMNFLIDGSGIIVAKGLRGEYLEDKLKEMVK